MLDNVKKFKHIKNMLYYYNECRMIFNYKISTENINKFPRKRVIEIFEPYLKKYLLARYSYCSDIRNKNKTLLNKSFKNFL